MPEQTLITKSDILAMVEAAQSQGKLSQEIVEKLNDAVNASAETTGCINKLYEYSSQGFINAHEERKEFYNKAENIYRWIIASLLTLILAQGGLLLKVILELQLALRDIPH